MKTNNELNLEELENISGGYIHYNEKAPGKGKWEIIDKQGKVVLTVGDKTSAQMAARNLGWTGIELSDEQIVRIWGAGKQD